MGMTCQEKDFFEEIIEYLKRPGIVTDLRDVWLIEVIWNNKLKDILLEDISIAIAISEDMRVYDKDMRKILRIDGYGRIISIPKHY